MRKIIGLIFFVALSTIFYQCAKDPVDLTGSISGTVTDSETKEPIKGASVVLTPGGDTKTTGTDGKFEFDDLDGGGYSVDVSCENYNTDNKSTDVVAGKSTQLDFLLTPMLPELYILTTLLDFDDETTKLSFEIKNSGKNTLIWGISETADWISVSSTSGSTTTDVATILVSVSRDNLNSGTYTDNIVVSSNAGSKEIKVTMEVAGVSMAINVESLDFGADKETLPIEITNSDKGTLEWEITETADWLSVSPIKGTTESDVSIVLVSVDRSGLSTGEYTHSLIISSNAGSKEIPIALKVSGSTLDVSPLDLDFGTVNTTEQLTLQNTTGIGNVVYTIEKSNDWITLDKTTGTLTEKSPTAVINVVVNRTGLSAGEFNGKITVKSDVVSDIECTVKMNIVADQKPTVSIGIASDITYNSASIEATVVSLGSHTVTKHGLCWSKNSEPTIDDEYSNLGDKNEIGKYTSILSNLESETKYYVRAYAINEVGTAYSSDYSFTTSGTPIVSTVKTTSATSVESTKATVNGSIENVGNSIIEEYGFVYNTDNNISTTSGSKLNLGSKGTEVGYFSGNISELQVATKYYFRAYAINEVGVSYGDILSFTTLTESPTITTIAASGITHNKATSGGEITYTGGNIFTERGVCWSEIATSPTVNDNYAISSDETTNFSAELTNLETTTSYYIRAYVRTSDNIYYGDVKQFVTTEFKEEPTVETNEVADISIDCATIYCYIPSDGGSTVTARGVCWSTTPGATTSNNIVSCGSGSGNYTASITGLSMGQTVYVKAYATNEVGTAYGEELSFTTRSSNVIYVSKTNGSDTNNGDSWSTAYATITKAIENAPSGFEVWVTNATISNEGVTMKEGVDVYGGFEGNETELSQRSADSYTTLLRQSITQSSTFSTETTIDGFNVSNTTSTAIILKSGGNVNNCCVDDCVSTYVVYNVGGKINNCCVDNCVNTYIVHSSDGNVTNSVIENCTAKYVVYAINTEIENCNILNNKTTESTTNGSSYDYKILTLNKSSINGSTISGNTVCGSYYGGLVSLTGSTMSNNIISGTSFSYRQQSTTDNKPLIEVNSSTTSSELIGNLFTDNKLYSYSPYGSTYYYHNMIYVNSGATLGVYNCSFVNNNSSSADAYDRFMYVYDSTAIVTMANCVFWNKSDLTYPVSKTISGTVSSNVYVTNCAFTGGYSSGTNVVTLTNEIGVNSPKFNDDYTLQSGSPLINAGDNSFLGSSYTTDLKGDTRIQNGRVDIGAYEYNY